MKIATIAIMLFLSGCAICERHPVSCASIGAIAVAVVAVGSGNHGHSSVHNETAQPVNCSSGSCL